MPRKSYKISTRWIRETREVFRDFLDETSFPDANNRWLFASMDLTIQMHQL